MATATIKDKLVKYLRDNPGWHKKGAMFALADTLECSPDTLSRKLREAAEEGSILVKYYDGAHTRNLCMYSSLGTVKKVNTPIISIVNGEPRAVFK